MTEIEEVAEAIKQKYPDLWPLTLPQAGYIAEKEAGDQGSWVVMPLATALLELNRSHP
jgi:hypothetical protein